MVDPTQVCYLDLHEAGRRVAEKAISPVELTEALLARIDAVDSRVRAYVTVLNDEARRVAREAEQSVQRGEYRRDGKRYRRVDPRACGGQRHCRDQAHLR